MELNYDSGRGFHSFGNPRFRTAYKSVDPITLLPPSEFNKNRIVSNKLGAREPIPRKGPPIKGYPYVGGQSTWPSNMASYPNANRSGIQAAESILTEDFKNINKNVIKSSIPERKEPIPTPWTFKLAVEMIRQNIPIEAKAAKLTDLDYINLAKSFSTSVVLNDEQRKRWAMIYNFLFQIDASKKLLPISTDNQRLVNEYKKEIDDILRDPSKFGKIVLPILPAAAASGIALTPAPPPLLDVKEMKDGKESSAKPIYTGLSAPPPSASTLNKVPPPPPSLTLGERIERQLKKINAPPPLPQTLPLITPPPLPKNAPPQLPQPLETSGTILEELNDIKTLINNSKLDSKEDVLSLVTEIKTVFPKFMTLPNALETIEKFINDELSKRRPRLGEIIEKKLKSIKPSTSVSKKVRPISPTRKAPTRPTYTIKRGEESKTMVTMEEPQKLTLGEIMEYKYKNLPRPEIKIYTKILSGEIQPIFTEEELLSNRKITEDEAFHAYQLSPDDFTKDERILIKSHAQDLLNEKRAIISDKLPDNLNKQQEKKLNEEVKQTLTTQPTSGQLVAPQEPKIPPKGVVPIAPTRQGPKRPVTLVAQIRPSSPIRQAPTRKSLGQLTTGPPKQQTRNLAIALPPPPPEIPVPPSSKLNLQAMEQPPLKKEALTFNIEKLQQKEALLPPQPTVGSAYENLYNRSREIDNDLQNKLTGIPYMDDAKILEDYDETHIISYEMVKILSKEGKVNLYEKIKNELNPEYKGYNSKLKVNVEILANRDSITGWPTNASITAANPAPNARAYINPTLSELMTILRKNPYSFVYLGPKIEGVFESSSS